MAKKKKNAPEEGAPAALSKPAPAQDPLPCEALFASGNSAGARRSAAGVLQSADADAEHKRRAQAVLDMVKLDWQPFAVFGALLTVLLVVFLNAIVARNAELKDMGPALDLTKAMLRVEPGAPSETVPAQGPVEENRGTP